MTYEEIFSMTKETFMKSDVSNVDEHLAIQVDIIGEGEGAFYVELKNKSLNVEPYEYFDHDLKLIATAKDFLNIANGKLDAIWAYTTGKLKIEGDLGKAMELQKIIKSIKKEEKKKSS